jgi:hypothetical protein
MTSLIYTRAAYELCVGHLNFEKDRFAVQLVGPGYSPNPLTHQLLSQIPAEHLVGRPMETKSRIDFLPNPNHEIVIEFGEARWTDVADLDALGAVFYHACVPGDGDLVAFVDFGLPHRAAGGGEFVLGRTRVTLFNRFLPR